MSQNKIRVPGRQCPIPGSSAGGVRNNHRTTTTGFQISIPCTDNKRTVDVLQHKFTDTLQKSHLTILINKHCPTVVISGLIRLIICSIVHAVSQCWTSDPYLVCWIIPTAQSKRAEPEPMPSAYMRIFVDSLICQYMPNIRQHP